MDRTDRTQDPGQDGQDTPGQPAVGSRVVSDFDSFVCVCAPVCVCGRGSECRERVWAPSNGLYVHGCVTGARRERVSKTRGEEDDQAGRLRCLSLISTPLHEKHMAREKAPTLTAGETLGVSARAYAMVWFHK